MVVTAQQYYHETTQVMKVTHYDKQITGTEIYDIILNENVLAVCYHL